jgi:hypothetical protein
MNSFFSFSESVAAAISEFFIFALCLFLQPADATSVRVDSIMPGSLSASYTMTKTADSAWEVREELGEDYSQVLYTVEVVDAKLGSYRFTPGEARDEAGSVELNVEISGFDNLDLLNDSETWAGLENGAEVRIQKSGDLCYLSPSDSNLTYVIHAPVNTNSGS